MTGNPSADRLDGIAIIGMSGRFPGAANIAEFWNNLKNGVESIATFSAEELEVPNAAEQARRPDYVRARAILDNIDQFEPSFFGIYPQEATVMDPQHRIFLECCWEALEDAAYDTFSVAPSLGVFAGCSPNSYFLNEVYRDRASVLDYTASYQVGHYTTMLGSIADTLATRVAYKLNLRGPAMTLLCACSTSLVAVCQACTNLLTFQCDVALAGGVSVTLPQKRGYLHQAGGMVSPDGHCRTFDVDAQGTVFGSGSGVVLLKRLADAVLDRDHIYAVIKGFATNNDGAAKAGFTAPSVEGQAAVIATAQAVAGIDPDSISYIEAHGTATPLGDPIEVAALTQVFRESTARKNFCALGTAKTNVGHLDVAAGVTGVIKTALSLKHRQLPPTLHFKKPNPRLNLETSPFYVNTELQEWRVPDEALLRAGVSAFGVGGTNAHVVMEEAPRIESGQSPRNAQLLLLSARSQAALDQASARLAAAIENAPDISLSDVSFTLAKGRRAFEYRRVVVCHDHSEALALLRGQGKAKPATDKATAPGRPICFLFPGQGSQYTQMGRGLYETESVFRKTVDECAELLAPMLERDLRDVMYPDSGIADQAQLDETKFAQPAIFVTEYALGKLWLSWGIQPSAMVGHSVGEFVAGCFAGVFSLPDALKLIAERARLMQNAPRGAMLSVRLPESDILPLLNGSLSLAASNAPLLSVVSGPTEQIRKLEGVLEERKVAARLLRASHAFHSSMMDGVLDEFGSYVQSVHLRAPSIPYVSCTTGDWITDAEATDPNYWTRHLRNTVRFSDAIQTLLSVEGAIFLEVGAGTTLQTLVRQNLNAGSVQPGVVSSLVESSEQIDGSSTLRALGMLWNEGVPVDWDSYFAGETPKRVSLPTYPFERSRFWADGAEPMEHRQTTLQEAKREDTVVIENSRDIRETQARRDRLMASLTSLVEKLSGMSASELNPFATFLELGFDSLFLTQVTQALQSQFAVKLTFRQLLDQLTSIDSLAEYLDETLPASALPEEAAARPVGSDAGRLESAPPAVPTNLLATSAISAIQNDLDSATTSSVERIMKEQLQAMSQLVARQLEALKIGGAKTATAAGQVESRTADAGVRSAPNAPEIPSANQPAALREYKPFGPYKPAQRVAVDLTERQRTYLDSLISRYTTKTGGSKALTEKYRRVLADPRVVSGFRPQWKDLVYPIVTNRSRGSKLWDIDGNEYIDLLNGFGPIALGHMPDFVREAAHRQLDEGVEIGPQTPLAGEVAELLCEITGMERATFCNTGSEAVMAAMRLARTVTGRGKVAFFSGDYHGNFDEVLAKRVGAQGNYRTMPIAPGIPVESLQNIVVLDFGSPEALEYIRSHTSELAAVLVEPIQSRHPAMQPREFLEQVRSITAASGTALIFDEIVTGFRVHLGGAQGYYGIRADLATYGKVLGGGFPIGAIAGSAQFMDALDGGQWTYGDDSFPEVGVTFFAGTFVRHPLALAAAKAVLTHLKQVGPALQETLSERTRDLTRRINEIFGRFDFPSLAECCGSVFYFSLPSSFKFGSLLYYHLREKGIHIQEGFPCFLTTAHSEADVERVVRAFEESIAEMSAGDVLPESASLKAFQEMPPAAAKATEAPITESQLEILLSAKLSVEANCSYNEAFTITLQGDVDLPALRSCLKTLAARHEILTSTFDLETRTIRFSDKAEVPIETVDFTTAEEPSQKLVAFFELDARTPFDLDHGPVARIRIVQLAPQHTVIAFTAHHIVCDGWSTNVLIEELGALYTSQVRGHKPGLPNPLPFSRYSSSLQKEAESAEAKTIEQYWLKQFEHLPPLLDLPVDRARPAVKSFPGGTVRRLLGATTVQALKSAGASHGCTLFVTLLAGFQALLSRLTGQDDIVVGIPAAAQSLLEGETLVGHCVNFLPLRTQIPAESTFAKILVQGKKSLLDAYEHQQYTFGTLVRKLGMVRDPSRLPLIEVQFNLERVGKNVHFEKLSASIDSCPKRFVNFDLFLNIVETPAGLILDCDYNTGLFDEETILRWLRCYESLLLSAVANLEQPIGKLQLLDEAERRELLVGRNETDSPYRREAMLHHLFEEQAAQNPSQIAVVYRGEQLSYGELDRRTDRLANFLRSQGVAANGLVAILMERSAEMVVAMLGILKAGGAYLPLDPSYPKERIDFILAEAKPSVILTQESLAPGIHAPQVRIVCLDSEWSIVEKSSFERSRTEGSATDLAYVIFTSGSTGKPKGVEISHRAVVNFLSSMMREPGLKPADRLLAVTTISFDIAGLEIFLPLVTGARLVVAGRDETLDGLLLSKLIREAEISVMQATPSTWRILLEAGWKPNPSIKMLCGGEALPRDLADELLAVQAELWNMYGPTETTIWSAVSRVNEGSSPVRIGPPIANTQFYVLDGNLQPQPLGVPGELYIGGDGLAKGYFKRPDLTAEKFVTDPFRTSTYSAAKMYRTGDLVRTLTGGELEFLGRLDNQVKVRGFRIELGEVEAVLHSHPGISEAVVTVFERRGAKNLAAYYTAKNTLASEDLRAFMAGSVPAYMVPTAYVHLAEIPRMPNGKVDRKALPAPNLTEHQESRVFRAPRNESESKLVAICSDVLMVNKIGIDDNLFELGADSIQIFRIVARANRANLSITAQQVLKAPRIIDIAATQSGHPETEDYRPIQPVSRQSRRVPVSKKMLETS